MEGVPEHFKGRVLSAGEDGDDIKGAYAASVDRLVWLVRLWAEKLLELRPDWLTEKGCTIGCICSIVLVRCSRRLVPERLHGLIAVPQ